MAKLCSSGLVRKAQAFAQDFLLHFFVDSAVVSQMPSLLAEVFGCLPGIVSRWRRFVLWIRVFHGVRRWRMLASDIARAPLGGVGEMTLSELSLRSRPS